MGKTTNLTATEIKSALDELRGVNNEKTLKTFCGEPLTIETRVFHFTNGHLLAMNL